MHFLLETVRALRHALQEHGIELIIRVGEPEQVLPHLCDALEIDRLCFVEEPGSEERAIENTLRDVLGTKVTALQPETVLDIDDPRRFARDLPEVFSRFRRAAEKKHELQAPTRTPPTLTPLDPAPTVELGLIPTVTELGLPPSTVDSRAACNFEPGETAGQHRVRKWIFEDDHLRHYKQTRNGMLGADYSSKFSPWIALGALSPRVIAEETLRYEHERVANESTYWLRFELLWREYFRLYLLKHGRRLFRRSGPAELPIEWGEHQDRFEAWKTGRTGIPLIDANMRELSATGFMSNRGRQLVASFLTKNLGIDWRWGARWFEHCLIDYCPAANWGNWAYAAGVGADPRGFRAFDVTRQAKSYDPDGAYVAHWLPELEQLNGMARHHPWQHGWPQPIVDLKTSMNAARTRWDNANRATIHRSSS